MTPTQLSLSQHAVLAYAIHHTGGKIDWFPDNIKGGARKKVLDGLLSRALIRADGTSWIVSDAGYDAMGCAHLVPTQAPADPELEADVAACEAEWAKETKTRTRQSSKQAEVIRMLQRPQGATISQICAQTGWQAHTVRGTFAGAFKKKLGLTLTSDKPQGGERVYRAV